MSGWYKRTAQKITFVPGQAPCTAVNADTITIVRELSSDQALRSATVAEAAKRVQSADPANSDAQKAALTEALIEIRSLVSPAIGRPGVNGHALAWPEDLGESAMNEYFQRVPGNSESIR